MLIEVPIPPPPSPAAVSNSIVVYLRLLTSAEIKTNIEYAGFLLHPETGEQLDPESFCNNFVEAVGKEAGESWFARSRLHSQFRPGRGRVTLSLVSALPPPLGACPRSWHGPDANKGKGKARRWFAGWASTRILLRTQCASGGEATRARYVCGVICARGVSVWRSISITYAAVDLDGA